MVPRNLGGDGSLVGTTVLQPQQSNQARKGILKRTNNPNNYDYELSTNHIEEGQGQKGPMDPDIVPALPLPLGLPPPPGSGPEQAVSGKDLIRRRDLNRNNYVKQLRKYPLLKRTVPYLKGSTYPVPNVPFTSHYGTANFCANAIISC